MTHLPNPEEIAKDTLAESYERQGNRTISFLIREEKYVSPLVNMLLPRMIEAAENMQKAMQIAMTHASDCAVHNEPTYPAGPCDCKPTPAPEADVAGIGEAKPDTHWARLVKRLLNPPFGTDTSERLLMSEAADAIRYLLERVSPPTRALMAEVAAWRECALYDPTMEGPRFKGWDRSALDRCRVAVEKAQSNMERQP